MKKLIIPIHVLLGCSLFSQSTTENYVESKTYLDSISSGKKLHTIQYFDGLGRPKQIVNINAAPSQKDVVTHIEYDSYGRQVDSWLPVPMNSLNGNIQSSVNTEAQTYYNDTFPNTHSNVEASPLDRPLSQLNQGVDWQNNPVTMAYNANIDGEVKRYNATFDYTSFQSSIVVVAPYGNNQLYKNSVTDEDGNGR